MKKLFGIFAAGVSVFALTSCKDGDEKLAKQFKTAFSAENLSSIESLSDGSYTFNMNTYDVYANDYEDTTVSGIFAVSGNDSVFDLSFTSDYYYDWDEEHGLVDANIIVASTNGEMIDIYMDGNYSYVNQSGSESHTLVEYFLSDYEDFYTEISESDAGDYDYIKFSIGNEFSSLDSIMGDLVFDTDVEDDTSYLGLSLADFIIDDFTTYETVSSTQSYAIIDFKLFEGKSREITKELMMATYNRNGYVVTEFDIDFELDWMSQVYPDAGFRLKLGMNPSNGTVNYLSVDLEQFYTAMEDDSRFSFELAYTDTSTSILLPENARVLDGNTGIIEEMVADLVYDIDYFLYDLYYYSGRYSDGTLDCYVGMTVDEYCENYYLPYGLRTSLDLEHEFLIVDGENYYVQLKWLDGSDVFTAPVDVTESLGYLGYIDIIDDSIDRDNFNISNYILSVLY